MTVSTKNIAIDEWCSSSAAPLCGSIGSCAAVDGVEYVVELFVSTVVLLT